MDILVRGIVKEENILAVGVIDTETVEKARVTHDTYPTASAALGRVISGALLLSAMLKEGQKVMIQVIGDGPIGEVFLVSGAFVACLFLTSARRA